jgi:hypothetical protein
VEHSNLSPTKTSSFHKLQQGFTRVKNEFSTNPREVLLRLFFYSLLILFPSNLAKSFIFPQSYVLGIQIDYLTPAIYLTEILVLGTLVLAKWHRPKSPVFLILGGFFLLSLAPSVLVAPLPYIAWLRLGEIFLWVAFAFWVSQNLSFEKDHRVVKLLGWGVLWVTTLAFLQFVLQRNLFGYWFLGEPTLFPSLGGVAKGSVLGREVLLPYGTFPHPNVMGGVLSILAGWFLLRRYFIAALASVLGILISFSRAAYASFVLVAISLVFANKTAMVLPFDFSGFWATPSVQRRLDLLASAWEMVKSAPLTGLGLGNFTKVLPDFGLPSGILLFIQPVHNIFALVAAESGLVSLLAVALLFGAALLRSISLKRFILTISLLQLLLLGMFDHYLYTLPQGLFILSLTLGLAFGEKRKLK